MELYYWDAKWIDDGQDAYGIIAATSEAEAIKELESYGYYTDILLRRQS